MTQSTKFLDLNSKSPGVEKIRNHWYGTFLNSLKHIASDALDILIKNLLSDVHELFIECTHFEGNIIILNKAFLKEKVSEMSGMNF